MQATAYDCKIDKLMPELIFQAFKLIDWWRCYCLIDEADAVICEGIGNGTPVQG